MANNIVDIKSIGSLLDGKNHFYVPCYQRGYRWNRKQVEELLGDLYSFRKQFTMGKATGVGNFYCLQPVIVREIEDNSVRSLVLGDKAADASVKLWELIDGQQRLTSIYILLAYLINNCPGMRDKFKKYYKGKELYSIFYESHPDTSLVLNSILEGKDIVPTDINSTHICNAVRYIDEWFDGEGQNINSRYNGGDGESIPQMQLSLIEQITSSSEAGPTKVIWYQLSNDQTVDPIREFTRINNGKIPLTDTELVKALLLQKNDLAGNNKVLEQAKVSIVWEQMENTLQRDDFWCFISGSGIDEEDRMGELLRLVYLKSVENDNIEIEQGDIFRYYYDQLEGLSSEELQATVLKLWTDIVDTFHTLQDWYETPEIYNYVGYLVQSGMPLAKIYKQAEDLRRDNEETTATDFLLMLKGDIRSVLPKNCIEKVELPKDDSEDASAADDKDKEDDKDKDGDKDNNYTLRITTEYPDRPNLRKLLLLLNVEVLSKQLLEIRDNAEQTDCDANVFKFPFGLYSSQKWDIEHIDSATTNAITDKESQRIWVEDNIRDGVITLTDAIKKKRERGEWADLVSYIQQQDGEEQENKNFIGNLTLLDYATNRSYGNALFRKKRKYIIENASKGRYVLPCTQYVFMKFFDMDNTTESRSRWTKEDKLKYHDFILEQLYDYLPIPKD